MFVDRAGHLVRIHFFNALCWLQFTYGSLADLR